MRNLASARLLPQLRAMAATVWRGRLAFGMVSVPVRLYKAARRERIRFHRVYRQVPDAEPPPDEAEAAEPVRSFSSEVKGSVHELQKRAAADAEEDGPEETISRVRNLPIEERGETRLDPAQILKGYEIEKDRYVTFDPAEVAALRPATSTELTITEFVKLGEIDPVFFETSYYAAPDTGGEKPYALLFRALAESGYAAIGSLAMHGREHAAVIRPGNLGLILHTLFYEKEVRANEQYQVDAALVNAKELELATRFIMALAQPFDAGKLKDTFEERLGALIRTRADRAVTATRPAEAPQKAPVVDIMEALRKSLEMARKPPKRERTLAPRAAKAAGLKRGRE
ncbi:MAG: Ku protein [Bryobacteraceae bacterium]